jgi:SAM-dependent methyltransferase
MPDSRATRRSYDTIAEDYAANLGAELDGKPLDRALLDLIGAAPGWVADLGAGPGHVGGYLAARGARVLASDLSPQMCATGARREGLPFVAGDLTALPLRSGSVHAIVCLYAVIHLDDDERARAYAEFARVLAPGGQALVSFHTSDADTPQGGVRQAVDMMGHEVELTFRFLDPEAELDRMTAAGLQYVARLDRAPHEGSEHPSRRSYLLVRRP